jgi:hypothetical protein
MGAAGAMMMPMHPASAAAHERDRELEDDNALAAAAVLYRPPEDMPVVTGAFGAQFVAGEEDE